MHRKIHTLQKVDQKCLSCSQVTTDRTISQIKCIKIELGTFPTPEAVSPMLSGRGIITFIKVPIQFKHVNESILIRIQMTMRHYTHSTKNLCCKIQYVLSFAFTWHQMNKRSFTVWKCLGHKHNSFPN